MRSRNQVLAIATMLLALFAGACSGDDASLYTTDRAEPNLSRVDTKGLAADAFSEWDTVAHHAA